MMTRRRVMGEGRGKERERETDSENGLKVEAQSRQKLGSVGMKREARRIAWLRRDMEI